MRENMVYSPTQFIFLRLDFLGTELACNIVRQLLNIGNMLRSNREPIAFPVVSLDTLNSLDPVD